MAIGANLQRKYHPDIFTFYIVQLNPIFIQFLTEPMILVALIIISWGNLQGLHLLQNYTPHIILIHVNIHVGIFLCTQSHSIRHALHQADYRHNIFMIILSATYYVAIVNREVSVCSLLRHNTDKLNTVITHSIRIWVLVWSWRFSQSHKPIRICIGTKVQFELSDQVHINYLLSCPLQITTYYFNRIFIN